MPMPVRAADRSRARAAPRRLPARDPAQAAPARLRAVSPGPMAARYRIRVRAAVRAAPAPAAAPLPAPWRLGHLQRDGHTLKRRRGWCRQCCSQPLALPEDTVMNQLAGSFAATSRLMLLATALGFMGLEYFLGRLAHHNTHDPF